ncbi:hypothetical protein AAFC00_005009 [Neodothiora populina]|uniref:Epoxide hydrolase n=1 Tax=Neodothiora populina TaxID=2781224 RepID=A0ABR3P438_9PEZI
MSLPQRPKVVLFDIGGVCVVSPFQAILDYEISHSIPQGWINHAISASAPTGSWQRLERGEIPLDAAFFQGFLSDLTDEAAWTAFHRKQKRRLGGDEAGTMPPVPRNIDPEWLFWEMMRVSRSPDPSMFPALERLRKHADALVSSSSSRLQNERDQKQPLLIAALSNTVIFPPHHVSNDASTPEGKHTAYLKSLFDVFVSSAHVGLRKPDAEIYTYTIDKLNEYAVERGLFAPAEAETGGGGGQRIRAQDIVFLDDIGSNLRTARAQGMRTVKVTLGRVGDAVRELQGVVGVDLSSSSAGSDDDAGVRSKL